ncbi:TetR/AcrR family transcriptional regulator [Shouchella patagoniensis]|uniref:TetR/AcrR family transcriptional regulator n=1 Tax=Shouchella patagoniensis TaxID=228576 RepID=UPI000994EEC2|nr:TetR/AcrR family transcriptional regulator [Shouchella patagoniensis]
MRNKEETYNQIVKTAYERFAKKGFHQTSLSHIASEVGISKPAIYYYFKSKDELIKSLFEKVTQEIHAITFIDTKTITKKNVKQSLYSIGENAIAQQVNDPHFNHLFNQYLLLASQDTYYSERLVTIQQDYLNLFNTLFTHAVEIGAIQEENILIKSQLLALVFDNITNFILTDMNLDYKKIWQEAVDSVLSGIEMHEQ